MTTIDSRQQLSTADDNYRKLTYRDAGLERVPCLFPDSKRCGVGQTAKMAPHPLQAQPVSPQEGGELAHSNTALSISVIFIKHLRFKIKKSEIFSYNCLSNKRSFL